MLCVTEFIICNIYNAVKKIDGIRQMTSDICFYAISQFKSIVEAIAKMPFSRTQIFCY